MPYIKKDKRKIYDPIIERAVTEILKDDMDVGSINYLVSSIVWKLFEKEKRYRTGNNLLGVLDCVSREFYRRKLAKYEDSKIDSEGDLDI